MSYHAVERPTASASSSRVVIAVMTAILLVTVLATAFARRPVAVTVDGRSVTVRAGTSVSDLLAAGEFRAEAGDLIAVDGQVARSGAGLPPSVTRNGAAVAAAQRVFRGDTLTSRPGADIAESVVVTTEPEPFRIKVEGSGPIAVVAQKGADGIRQVTRGQVSGIELTSTIVLEPRDEVIERTAPKPGSKLVALTFDDGPWPVATERILDILAKNDVRATFFVLGGRVKRSPEVVERAYREGHLIGAHSVSHRRFPSLTQKQIRSEVARSRRLIRSATGHDSTWLRPPYGAMNGDAWRAVRKERAQVVMWDVDSRDWKKPGAKKIAKSVVKHVKPGSIVLLHDGGGNRSQTVAALPMIIRDLKAKGYLFVTVEELVEASDVAKGPAARQIVNRRR